jgi:hypothetical protein
LDISDVIEENDPEKSPISKPAHEFVSEKSGLVLTDDDDGTILDGAK